MLQRLTEEQGRTWSRMQEILARAEDEGRDLTAEERQHWDAAEARLTEIRQDIERLQRMAALDVVDRSQIITTTAGDGAAERGEQPDPEARYAEVFGRFLRHGADGLAYEDRQLLAGHLVADSRAQATTPGTAGGYLIPTELQNRITEAMKAFGGILGVANVITTDSGNPLNWPTSDETNAVGAILAENTQVTEQDVTWGIKQLGAHTYTSKLVRVSLQLLQDSAFSLDTWLPRKLGERIGRALAAHLATGTGSGQPQGLFTAATVGVTGAAGQVDSVTYEDLIDLIHSVDPAYRGRARFVLSDAALATVRKLKDGQQRPLWEPSLQAGLPSTLLGYPVTVDNGVPAPGAGARSIGFGDVQAAYVVRQVSGGQLMRLTERYADYLQVGFLAFQRFDAVLDDAAAFRVYEHPES